MDGPGRGRWAPADYSEDQLDALQGVSVAYYWRESSGENGLVADKSSSGAPSSIAAVGMELATAPLAAEWGLLLREEIARRVLQTLRFFRDSSQGTSVDDSGYKGFYYHFLDMTTGRRVWECELSTIDTAFLVAGMLTAAAYFDRDSYVETELRSIADALYRRVDWKWAANGGPTLTHGWKPEDGGAFLPHRWTGYDEAVLMYILALGSPTHPLPPEAYEAYTSTYQWKEIYGYEHLYSGPLFTHQLSHIWIDFRDIRDAPMREHDLDYFQNSRRASYLHQSYAVHNPLEFEGYGRHCWGITACDGPGWETRRIGGVERTFYDYYARGAPYGPDDGTIAPWCVVASLPFAPEIVLPTIQHFDTMHWGHSPDFGFRSSFNRTYVASDGTVGWTSPYRFGIDQGPMALMIENYRSGRVWELMKRCPYVVDGLRRAGFKGGWLA